MAFVTHFESPDGEKLPIAAGACYAIRIPAAGAADKGNWLQTAEGIRSESGRGAPKEPL